MGQGLHFVAYTILTTDGAEESMWWSPWIWSTMNVQDTWTTCYIALLKWWAWRIGSRVQRARLPESPTVLIWRFRAVVWKNSAQFKQTVLWASIRRSGRRRRCSGKIHIDEIFHMSAFGQFASAVITAGLQGAGGGIIKPSRQVSFAVVVMLARIIPSTDTGLRHRVSIWLIAYSLCQLFHFPAGFLFLY